MGRDLEVDNEHRKGAQSRNWRQIWTHTFSSSEVGVGVEAWLHVVVIPRLRAPGGLCWEAANKGQAASRYTWHMFGLHKCLFNKLYFQSKGMGLGKYTDCKSGKLIKQFFKNSLVTLKIFQKGGIYYLRRQPVPFPGSFKYFKLPYIETNLHLCHYSNSLWAIQNKSNSSLLNLLSLLKEFRDPCPPNIASPDNNKSYKMAPTLWSNNCTW